MTLLMRDSTNASAIPLDGLTAVGGYADGLYEWSSADWARFDTASVIPIPIVTNPFNYGRCLDVEAGDASPSQIPGWLQRYNKPERPWIYCNRSTWSEAWNYAGNSVYWWIATLDGSLNVSAWQPAGADNPAVIQYKGSAQTGGNYDESIIFNPEAIGINPPVPPPAPTGDIMPSEVLVYVNEISATPVELGGVYNTNYEHVYVALRDSSNIGQLTGRVVLTNPDGSPNIFHDFSISTPGGYDEWAIPTGPVGFLVLQSVSHPCTVTVKVGTL